MWMLRVSCKSTGWLPLALESVRAQGCAIVEDTMDPALLAETRAAMYRAQRKIQEEVGYERLHRAGELGVLRLMLKFEPIFFRLLELEALLTIVDNTVSATAILHLQNGFILPSIAVDQTPSVFQNRFHQDFPRVFNGYLASINIMFAIDEFSTSTGATLFVPGTHQMTTPPAIEYLKQNAISVECSAGSIVVFDSTLWHAAGANT